MASSAKSFTFQFVLSCTLSDQQQKERCQLNHYTMTGIKLGTHRICESWG